MVGLGWEVVVVVVVGTGSPSEVVGPPIYWPTIPLPKPKNPTCHTALFSFHCQISQKTLGFHVMPNPEGRKDYLALYRHMALPPKVLVGDFNCQVLAARSASLMPPDATLATHHPMEHSIGSTRLVHPHPAPPPPPATQVATYFNNRVPNFLAGTELLIDKLHKAGHTCGKMYDSWDKRHVDVRNQSLAEQYHSFVSMFKGPAKVQTMEHTVFMIQKYNFHRDADMMAELVAAGCVNPEDLSWDTIRFPPSPAVHEAFEATVAMEAEP